MKFAMKDIDKTRIIFLLIYPDHFDSDCSDPQIQNIENKECVSSLDMP